jgi:hypothetical protein
LRTAQKAQFRPTAAFGVVLQAPCGLQLALPVDLRMPLMRKLLKALALEKTADMRPHSGDYADLLRVMERYSQGTGPAPSVEQFQEWREDVARNLLNAEPPNDPNSRQDINP